MKNFRTVTGLLDFSVVLFFALIVMLMLLWSCKHEPLEPAITADNTGNGSGGTNYNEIPCDTDSVYFTNTILPLFISNCAKSGCHDATTHEEGLVLDSYQHIMASGEIVPGNPSEGDIMEKITDQNPEDVMPPPPGNPLTDAQIGLIAAWISQGANENSCSSCDTVNVTYSGKIAPLIQTKCAGCHNNTTMSGNVNLSNYSGVIVPALNGRLLATVNHDAGYSAMPKGGPKLPSCEIDALRIWIENGVPNN